MMTRAMNNNIIPFFTLMFVLAGCAQIEPVPFEQSTGHIQSEALPQADVPIPDLVEQVPVLPAPSTKPEQLRFTVVVDETPVKEVLFALVRDHKLNIDIHPAIEGIVTLNVVEQTLIQILKRISKQVPLRYEFDDHNLFIMPDAPFFKTYKVDYVNLSREVSSENEVSTQIESASGGGDVSSGGGSGSGGGGGGSSSGGGSNNSRTEIATESNHHFWARLVSNIAAVIGDAISAVGTGSEISATANVIPSPETGLLTVKATSAQHEQVQHLLDQILASAKRQVLIQITIVEVNLSDQYQAGIDWSLFSKLLDVTSATAAGVSSLNAAASAFVVSNARQNDDVSATVTLLSEFGQTNILSSPQIMVLNNQTALLKVVDNFVYFEFTGGNTTSTSTSTVSQSLRARPRTVPIGISMSVTPQIDANGTVILNVRPTISTLTGTVNDPTLSTGAIQNAVPLIAVREMESVLRMVDGEIGVLGGLMTNASRESDAGLPGLKKVDFWGNLFKTTAKEYAKNELVIFIKPTIINTPSLDNDLKEYQHYLSKEQRLFNGIQAEGKVL